ncbi:MAG: carbohydrate kinase family protein [Eubacteriales bacterium]|nr:carbohydrate kinase family protein [Eubacteriales bacterium]
MSDIVVAGHICFDVIPGFRKQGKTMEELFVPGKLINMDGCKCSTGGPVSNTGIALAILGQDVSLMGKIGNDMFGNAMLDLLKKGGFEKGMIKVDGENTSYTVVIVPPGYDRIFLHHTGANDTFVADDIDYDFVKQAKLFHFGYPPLMKKMYENDGRELVEIFKRVKALGVTTSLDMSLPDANSDSGKADWEKILSNLLPYVDIYMPSVEETMYMIARDEFVKLNNAAVGGHDILDALDLNVLPELGDKLIKLGAKVAVIKCGVRGYYVRTARDLSGFGKAKPADIADWTNRELHEESFHVEHVAAATGSGDSSIAGFLAAFMNGETLEECMKVACAVGGENVQVFDALSGIKSWDETKNLMKDWPKNKTVVSGDYWQYDAAKKNWRGRKDGER